jgi:predicted esterase
MSSRRISRAARRVAVVCLAFSSVLASSFAGAGFASAGTAGAVSQGAVSGPMRSAHVEGHVRVGRDDVARGFRSSAPVVLHADGGDVMAFAPAKTALPLSVVYLHGMHGRADKGCPWMRSGASEVGWLVCPEAIEAEPNGVWSWGEDVYAQQAVVLRALHAAQAQGASREPGVAVGFSQGSYVTLDLIRGRLASFRGVVLLGAEVHPNVDRLRAGGVLRVALGAGSKDAAYRSMKDEALRLSNEGMEARFFDLGAAGHTYAAEDVASLRDAIAWAGAR